jgi:hypothetical protein
VSVVDELKLEAAEEPDFDNDRVLRSIINMLPIVVEEDKMMMEWYDAAYSTED